MIDSTAAQGDARFPRPGRWQQRFADAVLIVFILITGLRATSLALNPATSTEFVALHIVLLAFLAAVCALMLTWLPRVGLGRSLTVLTVAVFGTALVLFNMGGIIARVTQAPHVTMPFIADIFCAGRFDVACATRYPAAASVVGAIYLGFGGVFWLCYGGLRYRVAAVLSRVGRALPGFAARSLLVVFCLGYVGWQAFAWDDFIEREPLQQFFFAPFEIGPVEMLTKPPRKYQAHPTRVERPRPLVLIVVDALRADKVGLEPGKPTLTPFLRSLAVTGKLHRFDPAFSSCAFSYCGIASTIGSASWASQQLGPPIPISDVLATGGYRSYYLLGGIHRSAVNLGELYGPNVSVMIDDADRGASAKSDDYSMVEELKRLRVFDPSRSFFFMHLMSPHIAGVKRGLVDEQPASHTWNFVNQHFQPGAYRRTYDHGVAQADDVIRLIFAELDRRGMLDDALVAITADHGERLDPRSTLGHGGYPDLEVSQIPVLLFDAKAPRYPRHAIVSHLDVAPTLAHAAGLAPPVQWDGVALQEPSKRKAIAVDSRLRLGMATRIDGQTLFYTCQWRSGDENIVSASRGALTGSARARGLQAARKDYATLRRRLDTAGCDGRGK